MRTHALKQEQVPLFLNGATELRVVVKPQPTETGWNPSRSGQWLGSTHWRWNDCEFGNTSALVCKLEMSCPYPVGSELALTETWASCGTSFITGRTVVVYKADGEYGHGVAFDWRSPSTMPAEFSRFQRRVAAVRVERLQDITEAGADAACFCGDIPHRLFPHLFDDSGSLSIPECFAVVWNAAHPDYPWESNPWTWVLTLEAPEYRKLELSLPANALLQAVLIHPEEVKE